MKRLTQLCILIITLACSLSWQVSYAVKTSGGNSFDVIVTKRDTMQSIFKRYGLSRQDLYTVLRQVDGKQLESIKPGQLLHFDTENGKRLRGIKIFKSSNEILHVKKVNGHFKLSSSSPQKTGLFSMVDFTMKHSLYTDGVRKGLTPGHIAEISQVMQRDPGVDAKKLPAGTQIRIILEGASSDTDRKVVGIQLRHKRINWSVTRFHDKSGNNFYHPDGRTAAVSFLRYPMSSFRISSHFSLSRYHPIHHYRRPHYGVDLAAPRGTPVWATAQGKVVHVGWKGGYGKTVIIKHGAMYQTVYGHLSRFRAGLRVGDTVNQRQVIGYVGSTGHATGAHLHYEFRKNGRPLDPVKTRLPTKSRLGGTLFNAFKQYRAHIEKSLNARV